ncbi:MAG: protein-export chaperone SecB [Neomegalonema sp.]|nr:protein-export chaperone SecB [Neomegalonema sp.]
MTDQADSANKTAQLTVLSQFVRNVNFENSAANKGANPSGKPNINVNVNVDAKPLSEDRYSVSLKTVVNANTSEMDVFKIDLDYVGVFQLANVPKEALQPVLLIECPRLLFPFSRRIIAEISRDGGFPPLMLDPIDFAALYRRQLAAAAQQAQTAPTA